MTRLLESVSPLLLLVGPLTVALSVIVLFKPRPDPEWDMFTDEEIAAPIPISVAMGENSQDS